MSSGTDWSQLGKTTQEQFASEQEARRKSEESAKASELEMQQRKVALQVATEKVIGSIYDECKRIASVFNTEVKNNQLVMTVFDETRTNTGMISFATAKNGGFPRVKVLKVNDDVIEVRLFKGKDQGYKIQSSYRVSLQGELFASTTPIKRSAFEVADAACNALTGADYISTAQ